MKISVIGGGAWGTTLAQLLTDNGNEVLIYEINNNYLNEINNNHIHPIFKNVLDEKIKATNSLEEAIDYSDTYLLAVPTKAMRTVLGLMDKLINRPSIFINVSKGIEPETLKRVSEIVDEEINPKYNAGYVCLTGPSHAEEVIERKLTLLVSASLDNDLAVKVQNLFANDKYIRVYTSNDLIGSEVGGAAKNAIAVISGACTGLGLGENARAAVITRGILEIVRVVEFMGGRKETAFGLTGIGDLIVTASSENSRNFQGGKKIGQGMKLDEIYANATQTIEGFRTIYALHELSEKFDIELPMISTAYEILENKLTVEEGMKKLLKRDLKAEDFS
ncbi:NAD(P)H-dependent glycerol-3-phosphate dehydrogenase [Haploplasma axanthum]|uniref:Glycerol-3-phosphate dehydrogenase [NAD(P)+] n=1 Tax=Haploplasma axanthum TaxID=29552 RepID=A0A449BE32_HAPAX|nr:NAD(P)H-dependent glycerol-3-phosphate dehydrogenase [Haploplasma axanthum]VEU80696.1 glycerol-3-phosphate dehydrogenase [Haploplasma axanthum]